MSLSIKKHKTQVFTFVHFLNNQKTTLQSFHNPRTKITKLILINTPGSQLPSSSKPKL